MIVRDEDDKTVTKNAVLDKASGTATATLSVPDNSKNSTKKGNLCNVFCKIGNRPTDTKHTARFNVSGAPLWYGIYRPNGFYVKDTCKPEIQMSLTDVQKSSNFQITFDGYNIDLTKLTIQLYDSTGTACYDSPVEVPMDKYIWTETTGNNESVIETELPVPEVDGVYTVIAFFDGVAQIHTDVIQFYDTPEFTSIDIPMVSKNKAGSSVTARIVGKNFDSPEVESFDFNASCPSNSAITSTSSFSHNNDFIMYATFTIPEDEGDYEIIVSYGSNQISGVLKVRDFSNYSVGDVLFNDGTVIPYDAQNLTFTDEQKKNAVGIIYGFNEYGVPSGYLGIRNSGDKSPEHIMNDYYPNRRAYSWAKNYSGKAWSNYVYSDLFTTVEFGDKAASFTDNKDGKYNWDFICMTDPFDSQNPKENYPVFTYALNYGNKYILAGKYKDGWYIPSTSELYKIYRNKILLDKVLSALDGDLLRGDIYWSSSLPNQRFNVESYKPNAYAVGIPLEVWTPKWSSDYDKVSMFAWDQTDPNFACCVRPFE